MKEFLASICLFNSKCLNMFTRLLFYVSNTRCIDVINVISKSGFKDWIIVWIINNWIKQYQQNQQAISFSKFFFLHILLKQSNYSILIQSGVDDQHFESFNLSFNSRNYTVILVACQVILSSLSRYKKEKKQPLGVILNISQYSKENPSARVSFLIKL